MIRTPSPNRLTAWSVARRGVAPQDGLDPEHQFARAERLGHVIVGAELESGDPVLLTAPGRQHQDRHRADRLHLPGDRFPRHVRQAQVKHDQIGLGRSGITLIASAPESVESTANPARSR